MGLLLAIDGALGAFSAALVARDASVPPARSATTAGGDALERGLQLIDEVLAGTSLGELDALAVGLGPGSLHRFAHRTRVMRRVSLSRRPCRWSASRPTMRSNGEGTPLPSAAFVHGRTGLACMRLRTERGNTTLCAPYAELAETVAAELPPESELHACGALEGVTSELGERGIIVRPRPPAEQPPALAIALRALRQEPAASPHAVRADYGERTNYAERSPQARPSRRS